MSPQMSRPARGTAGQSGTGVAGSGEGSATPTTCIDCDRHLHPVRDSGLLCRGCFYVLIREPYGTDTEPSRFMLYAKRGWLR